MKSLLIILFSCLCIVGCGANGMVNQPITTPTVLGDNSKTVRYNVFNGLPSHCNASILVNGHYIDSNSYSVDCEYNNDYQITAFLITYRISLPTLATLQYSIF